MDSHFHQFITLVEEVQRCKECPRMLNSARVLSEAAGNLNADLMFIGEAPGRLGADQTLIPFHGDKSGHNFEDLLEFSGISRSDIYITNAALCNPKNKEGKNSTPNVHEIRNCSNFLKRQINLVNPHIIVTLGGVALNALSEIEKHNLTLRDDIRTVNEWYGRKLIPLYHPGQRAMLHRSKANQRSDFQYVAEQFSRLYKSTRKPIRTRTRNDILSLCRYILLKRGRISYFELHKLAYLTEYMHVKKYETRLTRGYYIRQKDGPYCTDLHISRITKAGPDISVTKHNKKLYLNINPQSATLFDGVEQNIKNSIIEAVEQTLERYSDHKEDDLKRTVYLTAPMRVILRREMRENTNLYNSPIDFLVAHPIL